MPFVTVQGLPKMLDDEVKDFVANLQSAVCGVEELDLKGEEDEVTVILMQGMTYEGQRCSILLEITGLRDEPERTPEVRKRVAGAVGRVGDQHFPGAYVASRVGKPYDYKNMPFWDNED